MKEVDFGQNPPQKESKWLLYSQVILQKVSFDKEIFRKELLKSLQRLNPTDIARLEAWCINTLNVSLAVIAIQVIQEYGMMGG